MKSTKKKLPSDYPMFSFRVKEEDKARLNKQIEKAVKLAPRLGDDIYLRLGTMAYKDHDRDVALLLWRRALELNPKNDAVRSNLEMLQAE